MVVDSGLREGDYFGVPLAKGGFGLGVAARLGRSGLVLGYFSPARYETLPSIDEIDFSVESSVWVKLFGDLGIIEGRWPTIGSVQSWNPEDWPLPDFVRHEELSGRCYRVSYGGDLRSRPTESLSRPEDVRGLPEHGVAGAKFVELKLEKLLTANQ